MDKKISGLKMTKLSRWMYQLEIFVDGGWVIWMIGPLCDVKSRYKQFKTEGKI